MYSLHSEQDFMCVSMCIQCIQTVRHAIKYLIAFIVQTFLIISYDILLIFVGIDIKQDTM